MKDSQLYLVVGLLICIDIITMLVWQIFDPFFRMTKELEPYVSSRFRIPGSGNDLQERIFIAYM
jgi:hypothetical protein